MGRFLYVNNDASTNSVTGFAINQTDGSLSFLAGSPYATGGSGQYNYYAAKPIALAPQKEVLFAANKASDTITAFKINPDTGVLTAIGAPVAGGGTMGASGSLEVNPAETLLFAANDSSQSISVFSIALNGAITPVAGSPFAIGTEADGISLSPDGTKLYVAAPNLSEPKLGVLSVAPSGALSHIAGSPFSYTDGNELTSFVLSSLTVGLGGATGGILSSYTMAGTGGPTGLVSSLVIGIGGNQQSISTGRNGQLAILSGGLNIAAIGVAQVAADGSLTQVPGSPFATTHFPSGYAAVHPSGDYLYATEGTYIETFNISPAGALTSLGVNAIGVGSGATGLVIY